MYLKSMEMQGFKSFPDRTKLEFGKGATVIIGPNGSGKSNISDAMRWVLGEISSKSIRGSKMEDIIFGGADSRRPMGFAEVSVTFDNSEEAGRIDYPYDEITVTRKYFRGGDSEYYINKKAVRLRDIYEMFMNTGVGRDGYSIIGQGKIAEIISRKDDERRSIFEDAAGIAKYRHKKNEAERHLKQTEDNMERAADILAELQGRLGPLEKESIKAKRYVEYFAIKKEADVRLWLYDTEKIREKIREAEQAYRMSELELASINEELDSLSAREEALSGEMMNTKALSEKLNDSIKERMNLNHELDNDIKLAQSDISHANELIGASKAALTALEGKLALSRERLESAKAAFSQKQAEGEKLGETQILLLRKADELAEKIKSSKEKIDTAFADISALESELSANDARVSVIRNSGNADVDRHVSLKKEIDRFNAKNESENKKLASMKQTVEEYDNAIEKENSNADSVFERLASLKEESASSEETLKQLRLNVDMLSQRITTLKSMEEQFEGYHYSVKYIMKEYKAGKLSGKIYGPLSSVISVGSEYLTAIENSLGASLQHIVVDDENTAKNAILALKEARAGVTTFYPITSMSQSQTSIPKEVEKASSFRGYVGRASELVDCDAEFLPIIESLLGRTVVFDNIDNAIYMAKKLGYRVRAVTLDGQQINHGGSFTGGSVKHSSSLLSRGDEIKKLTESLDEANKKYDAESKIFASVSEELSSAENEYALLGERIRILGSMRAAEEAEYQKLLASVNADGVLIEKLNEDLIGISNKKQQYDEEVEKLEERSSEIRERIEAIKEYRLDEQTKLSELDDAREDNDKKLTEIRIGIGVFESELEIKRLDTENAREAISAAIEGINAEKARIKELENKIEILRDISREKTDLLDEGITELSRLNDERLDAEKGNAEFDKKMSELRSNIKEKNDARDSISASHMRNENTLTQLREEQDRTAGKLWEDYNMTRADAIEQGYTPVAEDERAAVAKTQNDYRNKLRVMGSVNVSAIEEYEEVKTRYDKLSEQMNDLTESKKDLLRIITSLEKEMRTAFTDTFNKINENFGKTFNELFGGGSAELILTDPDDVLTSGIEIKAAPPGKIIKNLVQLSGGEQSFVAIALFFAILGVNPTPFCILDEIEAALDEVNVDRLARYISRYSGKTQFILITHRRGTMDAANILYGVTMPEKGISKVLALNVEEISKQKGEEWDGIFG